MENKNRPTGAERLFSKISDEEFSEELTPEEPEKEEDEPVLDDEEYSR